MSAKAISEKSGKELLAKVGVIDEALVVAIGEDTKLDDSFIQAHPWLQTKVSIQNFASLKENPNRDIIDSIFNP